MARLIKAHSDRDNIIFEMGVAALTEQGAEKRAIGNLLIRNPGETTALNGVQTKLVSGGLVKDYRVLIFLDHNEDLRNRLRIDEAIEMIEGLL